MTDQPDPRSLEEQIAELRAAIDELRQQILWLEMAQQARLREIEARQPLIDAISKTRL